MIDVVLDKELSNIFGKLSKEGLALEVILSNTKNKICINKTLIQYFKENISDAVNLERWQNLFVYMSDIGKIKSINNSIDILDTDKLYSLASSTCANNVVFVLKCNSNLPIKHYECLLSDSSKENDLLINLLKTNSLTFYGHDFDTNDQIENFLDRLFRCVKINNRAILVSRYSNFDCNIIKLFSKHYPKNDFWTTYSVGCPSNNLKFIKSKLGEKTKLYTVKTSSELHERRFIINSLIINFDEDFINIEQGKDTWKCDCTIDYELSKTFKSSKSLKEIKF